MMKKNKGQQFQRNNNQGQTKQQKCKSRYFTPIDDPTTAEYADYQEIKVQETFKTLRPGLIPRSICVILQNTLVGSVKPGDDVMLTGILV